MKRYKLLVYIFAAILPLSIVSQSLKINGVETRNFPLIQVEFTAKSKAGSNLTANHISAGDITLTENGIVRTGTLECPPASQTKFSTILVMDRSKSMFDLSPDGLPKWKIAQAAALEWVNQIPKDRFECALMGFNGRSYLIQDFTDNKDTLRDKLNSDKILPEPSNTDYNAAFLYDQLHNPGSLMIAEGAKYPVYIIFLTDGTHNAGGLRGDIWADEIVGKSKEIGATIYSITIGELNYDADSINLRKISYRVYFNKKTKHQLVSTYVEILNEVKAVPAPPPCIFTFEGDCESGGDFIFNIKNEEYDLSASGYYDIPAGLLPGLKIEPGELPAFLNIPDGQKAVKNIKLTAINNFVEFYGPPTSSSQLFKILDWPKGKLNKGESFTMPVEFSSPVGDSSYIAGIINFNSSACGVEPVGISAGRYFIRGPVDMGVEIIGNTKKKNYDNIFVNNSGADLEIKSVKITGAEKEYFEVEKFSPVNILPHGQSINLELSLTRKTHRLYIAFIEVETASGEIFTTKIRGSGSGLPEISAEKLVVFPDTLDCEKKSSAISYKINNPGAVVLNVNKITAVPESVFRIIGDPVTLEIEPEESKTIQIEFNPGSPGLEEGILTIYSDANLEPKFTAAISGYKEIPGFDILSSSFEMGILCPGETAAGEIEISSHSISSITEINISAEGDINPDHLEKQLVIIHPASPQKIKFSVEGFKEGKKSGKIILEDIKCGIFKEVSVEWEIIKPEINKTPYSFSANINDTDKKEVLVENTSGREITITNAHLRHPEFGFESQPSFPIILAPEGGTHTFSIIYAPKKEGGINSKLILEGFPCSFLDSISLNGMAASSFANVSTGSVDACAGQVVPVPVFLSGGVNVENSGAKSISLVIAFDGDILQPVNMPAEWKLQGEEITIPSVEIQPINGKQKILDLEFKVNGAPPAMTAEIQIISASANEGNLSLGAEGGFVHIGTSYLSASVSNNSAKPGGIFNLQLDIVEANICNPAFHETISFEIKYNKTIMNYQGSLPVLEQKEYNMIRATLPAGEIKPGYTLGLPFLAMLGNQKTDKIEITGVQTGNGAIDYEVSSGSFALDICEEGPGRLFNPFTGIAGISSLSPNPSAGSQIEINFNLIEIGRNEIILTDASGAQALRIDKLPAEPGSYSFHLNTAALHAGVYFLVLKTPSQAFTRRLTVIK